MSPAFSRFLTNDHLQVFGQAVEPGRRRHQTGDQVGMWPVLVMCVTTSLRFGGDDGGSCASAPSITLCWIAELDFAL